jgi:chorismate dehydratase
VGLRLAAISFLNPAPLLYDFEHAPRAAELASRYELEYMSPAACAAKLLSGEADLGLIPVASLTPQLRIVPGCAIASQHAVRSILLLVKNPRNLAQDQALRSVSTIAADAASRSSQAYVRVLLEHFFSARPALEDQPADALAMLASADAALLIGDPALLVREQPAALNAAYPGLLWIDVATLWRECTQLPWVAAVWAVRPEALQREAMPAAQLIDDLVRSRDAGLAHIDELVAEWTPRIAIAPQTIREYLTRNIAYTLDEDCLRAIQQLRSLAAAHDLLPPLDPLPMLVSVL